MTTEIIIGSIGLVIAIITFVQSQKPQEIKFIEPKEEMDNLKINFKVNQKTSLEVQDLLEKYIEKNNCSNQLFFQNLTFAKYLEFIKSNYEECLSETIYQRTLSNEIYTRPIIESMTSSLQNQYNNLLLVKNYIKSLG
ncbi:hypothetical protein EV144_1011382 [Flavobacterium sp. 270]|uniref:hypothetical protein n=1 Tax=Flavobacterium sp. 270 TaxID=2512114 RepID=UPI001064DE27|nr:hypothetical protein [Flavobacterium sp. 270]TDW52691.1 hypothetical protein EV144_1011382 [Flavobacterium sp. 270]